MMMVSESFCEFFDKVKSEAFGYNKSINSWCVYENANANTSALKDLIIEKKDAEFIGFNQFVTKSMCCLTTKRSSKFKDKECDGVAFVNCDNKESLLFVELKSKYDTSPISDAIIQMCFSFLKMHSLLSLCKGYSLENLSISFCAATKCAKDKDEDDKVKMFIYQALMSEEQKKFGKFFEDLLYSGTTRIEVNDLFQMLGVNLPLNDGIKHKEITVFCNLTKKYNDDSSVFLYRD